MRTFILALGFLLAACGGAKPAPETTTEAVSNQPWVLDETQSRLSFLSVKKGTIIEVHSFGQMTGDVSSNSGTVNIILDTVSTNIDIRDTRMREYLFETNQYPFAHIETPLTPEDYTLMKTGEQRTITQTVEVNMHGHSFTYDIPIVLTRLGVNKVQVQSAAPIIVEAADFGFETGIERLRSLASLSSITYSVPVSFSLVFTRS